MITREQIEVVGYETARGYDELGLKWVAGLRAVGVAQPQLLSPLDRGAWTLNTHIKTDVIIWQLRQAIETGEHAAILYVDVDTEFSEDPRQAMADLLNKTTCDFAAYVLKDRELLTGTLLFRACPASLALAEHWRTWNLRRMRKPDGPNLQDALAEMTDVVKVERLPPEFVYIFDTFQQLHPGITPVIKHLQASRTLRVETALLLAGGRVSLDTASSLPVRAATEAAGVGQDQEPKQPKGPKAMDPSNKTGGVG